MFKFLRKEKPRPQPTVARVDPKPVGGKPIEGPPMKPTVGRIVHVHNREGSLLPGQPEAAIVCSVGSAFVRVVGFDANGNQFRAELTFHGDPRVPHPPSQHAAWPPLV